MILDASVILKWFIEEKDTDKALKIRDDYVAGKIDIEIPDLLIYELANVLRYKQFTAEEIKSAVKSIFDMDFLIVTPTPLLIYTASKIALAQQITVYDATYVALADYLNAPFITADKKLYERTHKDYKVILLSNYE